MSGRSKAPFGKSGLVPARDMGIPCGVCGLPGLGFREITARHGQGAEMYQVRLTALACCFCHSVVPVRSQG